MVSVYKVPNIITGRKRVSNWNNMFKLKKHANLGTSGKEDRGRL